MNFSERINNQIYSCVATRRATLHHKFQPLKRLAKIMRRYATRDLRHKFQPLKRLAKIMRRYATKTWR
jgi:hypothetical protein